MSENGLRFDNIEEIVTINSENISWFANEIISMRPRKKYIICAMFDFYIKQEKKVKHEWVYSQIAAQIKQKPCTVKSIVLAERKKK
jgi:hypothetical protein